MYLNLYCYIIYKVLQLFKSLTRGQYLQCWSHIELRHIHTV